MNYPCNTCKHCKKKFLFVGPKYCEYGLLGFCTIAAFVCPCYDHEPQFIYHKK